MPSTNEFLDNLLTSSSVEQPKTQQNDANAFLDSLLTKEEKPIRTITRKYSKTRSHSYS